jgi:hypothetical protein
MHPGVDPCDRDRPAPVPSGTKRVKVETPSVVSRADRVAPDAESRLSRLPRVSRGCTHRSHPEGAPAACVSTPCGALRGQRLADDSPCGSSCVRARDASDRLLPSHVFVRAPVLRWFPFRSRACARASRGDFLVHARESSLQRAALAGFSSSREALSSPRHVCGRASDIPVAALRCTVCARTPGVTVRVAKATIPLPA